jgi:hypothetical protein
MTRTITIQQDNATRTLNATPTVITRVLSKETGLVAGGGGTLTEAYTVSETPPTATNLPWYDPSDGTWSAWDTENEVWVVTSGPGVQIAHASTHATGGEDEITPSDIGAVATTILSTNGGASKVPQFDANGDLRFSGSAPTGDAATIGGVFFQDLERLWFLNSNRSDGGSIFYYTAHDVNGGEMQINTAHRIALCLGTYGALQIGLVRGQGSTQYCYMQRRSNATAGVQAVSSLPLYFSSAMWNGSASQVCTNPGIVSTPTGTGTDADLIIFNPGSFPNEAGTDGVRTEVARFAKTGLRLTVQDETNTDAAMSRSFSDGRYPQKAYANLNADTEGVTASATPVDSGLEVALGVGTWQVKIFANETHSAAGGIRLKTIFSGTIATQGGIVDRGNGGVVGGRSSITGTSGADGLSADLTYTGATSSNHIIDVVYDVTVAGTFKLQYAQSTSDATATVLKKGTHIIALRIA